VTERFAADWLALREPFDRAARSLALARRLAERLPRRPRLVDLGAGTGSMFRFLAPIIGRGQDWVLVDADAALLDEAFGRTAAWARHQGFAATAADDELLLSTPHGLWRMRVLNTPLPLAGEVAAQSAAGEGLCVWAAPSPGAARRPLPQAGEVDAVVCSALLDLVSAAWLARLCDTLTVPLLACLTVDGRDVWRPRHPLDTLVRAAFRRDMRRDKGFGPALGTTAPRVLATRGLVTASAPSDWNIPRSALRMQRALIDGIADAARHARPAHTIAITAWQEARLRQALRGRLAITIGHRDILALPPGG
jgi:SAM-dependent methyltransferase